MSGRDHPRLSALLSNPFVGFAPWVLVSVVEGPHRLVLAAALGGALAVAILVLGTRIGQRPKLLDVAAIVYFAALVVVASVIGPDGRHWLELWGGELSNVAIALLAVGSIAAGSPFTIQYARESTDRAYWDTPQFHRVNLMITWAWTAVFAATAVLGWVGDGPLHQPDNLWTNWIVQIAMLLVAVRFTDFYPDYAGLEPAQRPSRGQVAATLLRPLVPYLAPVGVIVLIVSEPKWLGVAFIVVGVIASRGLRRSDAAATGAEADGSPGSSESAALDT